MTATLISVPDTVQRVGGKVMKKDVVSGHLLVRRDMYSTGDRVGRRIVPVIGYLAWPDGVVPNTPLSIPVAGGFQGTGNGTILVMEWHLNRAKVVSGAPEIQHGNLQQDGLPFIWKF